MARTAKTRIDTRSARARLAPRHAPYWHPLERGIAVGYYQPRKGAGSWWARAKVGDVYRTESLGLTDDEPGGLSWARAQGAAREWANRQTAAGPETVAAICAAYVDDLRARKGERAARETEVRIAKQLLPVLGGRPLAELTAADITAWRNGMVRNGGDDEAARRSRDTANRMLAVAKAAFNMAFNTGRVTDDRAWRRVQAFRGVGEARKVILSADELQRLVDACEPGLRELVLVGAETGARFGEIAAARVRDLDGPLLRVSGKTGTREIHLPPAIAGVLRRLASGKRPADLLLTTTGGRAWATSLYRRPFAAAVARAGLDPETTFYALRHSYISRALVAGVPTKAVADHCGTSATMIERFYAKFVPNDRARYAVVASAGLTIGDADARVVPLRG